MATKKYLSPKEPVQKSTSGLRGKRGDYLSGGNSLGSKEAPVASRGGMGMPAMPNDMRPPPSGGGAPPALSPDAPPRPGGGTPPLFVGSDGAGFDMRPPTSGGLPPGLSGITDGPASYALRPDGTPPPVGGTPPARERGTYGGMERQAQQQQRGGNPAATPRAEGSRAQSRAPAPAPRAPVTRPPAPAPAPGRNIVNTGPYDGPVYDPAQGFEPSADAARYLPPPSTPMTPAPAPAPAPGIVAANPTSQQSPYARGPLSAEQNQTIYDAFAQHANNPQLIHQLAATNNVTYDQIANALGQPIDTVRQYFNQAGFQLAPSADLMNQAYDLQSALGSQYGSDLAAMRNDPRFAQLQTVGQQIQTQTGVPQSALIQQPGGQTQAQLGAANQQGAPAAPAAPAAGIASLPTQAPAPAAPAPAPAPGTSTTPAPTAPTTAAAPAPAPAPAPAGTPNMGLPTTPKPGVSTFKYGGMTTSYTNRVGTAAKADMSRAGGENKQRGVGLATKGLGKFKVR